jgi:nitrogen-specific signal transduction histidine kinase
VIGFKVFNLDLPFVREAAAALKARQPRTILIAGGPTPSALREKIFEPLFSTKNFGVGLGVPIIKNIMEDHGGGVSYASKVGEGTAVTLWLPLPVDAGLRSV